MTPCSSVDINVLEEPGDSFRPENSDSTYLRTADKLKDITFTSANLHFLFVYIFLLLFDDDFILDYTASKGKVIREHERMSKFELSSRKKLAGSENSHIKSVSEQHLTSHIRSSSASHLH